ncbi:MAG: M24B family metallopeptidase, partial [Rhodospirillaceae bacterium]
MNAAEQARRLEAVRTELRRRNLDAFVVPRADEHQGEYVPPSAERLSWLTGFTGSAGAAVVMRGRAALFIDGRYTLQAEQETSPSLYEYCHLVETPPAAWLGTVLRKGARVGYDTWLHTPDGAGRLHTACADAGAELVAVDGNPVDAAWTDRPAPPQAPVVPHALDYAGETADDKRRRVGAMLAEAGQDACILSVPESLAWLLNLRGGDVPFTPLPLGFAILAADGAVDLFMDPAKLSDATCAHLGKAVWTRPLEDFGAALDNLKGKVVRLDHASAPMWVFERLRAAGAVVKRGDDPCALPRACKNGVELAGMRAAHRRDGAALVRFLAWLDRAEPGLTEMAAADRLEAFRAEGVLFKGLSFPTIAGSGPNGAIVHYRVSPDSDRALRPGELFLVDSGAQYMDGTTDVTRTVAVGTPTEDMQRRFTQVLKGHIALARAVFPVGTTGSQLDVLARQALWADGVDYDHGTGHGVGSYLSVHEGPQRVSKVGNTVALKPGMVLSVEPGYYK